MSAEILQNTADIIKDINKRIADAKELLAFLTDAGEDVTQAKSDLRNMEQKKRRYELALQKRGITVEE